MNTTRGTFAILLADFKLYILIFWGISIIQTFLMVVIGANVSSSNGVGFAIGSLYGGVIAFSALIYASSYRPAISLGSTRPQYLKIFSWLIVLFTVSSILMVNVLYYIIHILHERDISTAYFFHPGMAITDYQFGVYMWVDLMVAFGLVGITLLITSSIFRYGFLRVAVIGMILGIALTIGFVFGDAASWFYTLFVEKASTTFNTFGIVGILLIFLNAILMRHAPLTYNAKNG